METRIRINTDELNMDILEGIQKMFPHKEVEITVQQEYWSEEEIDEANDKNVEDATQFILNRPAYAAELLRRIKSIENNEAQLINVNLKDLVK